MSKNIYKFPSKCMNVTQNDIDKYMNFPKLDYDVYLLSVLIKYMILIKQG